jgi:hypothetical protein
MQRAASRRTAPFVAMHPEHPAAVLKLEFHQDGPKEGNRILRRTTTRAAHGMYNEAKLDPLVEQVYDTARRRYLATHISEL